MRLSHIKVAWRSPHCCILKGKTTSRKKLSGLPGCTRFFSSIWTHWFFSFCFQSIISLTRHVTRTTPKPCHIWCRKTVSLLCGRACVSSGYVTERKSCRTWCRKMAYLLCVRACVSSSDMLHRNPYCTGCK